MTALSVMSKFEPSRPFVPVVCDDSQRSGPLLGTCRLQVHVSGDVDLPKAISTTHYFVIKSPVVLEVSNRVLNDFCRTFWLPLSPFASRCRTPQRSNVCCLRAYLILSVGLSDMSNQSLIHAVVMFVQMLQRMHSA